QELVLVDRTGKAELLPLPPAAFRFPRFSPDGRRLAFGIGPIGGGDIWTYELASRRSMRLTVDSANAEPEWTPDGRSLVFPRDLVSSALYRVSADGSSEAAPFFARAG